MTKCLLFPITVSASKIRLYSTSSINRGAGIVPYTSPMNACKENMSVLCITLKPHFCIENLGFAGYIYFFFILIQNIDCV